MGEIDFKEAFKPLRNAIEDFAFFGGLIHANLIEWENIIGINAKANIEIKKQIIMSRVQKQIDVLNVPFEIQDCSPNSPFFQITIKEL